MAFVKMDEDKLQDAVDGLTGFADDAEASVSTIRSRNVNENSPADLSALGGVDTKIDDLRTAAQEIQTRLDSAKSLNSNGVSAPGAEAGMLYYYVAEGQEDTAANVESNAEACQQAITDARSASTASGEGLLTLMNGSVKDHENDEVYAAVFADTLGAEGMATLAYQIQSAKEYALTNVLPSDPKDPDTDFVTRYDATAADWNTALAALSITFGTATCSSTWTPAHRTEYAHSFASLATDPNAPVYLPYGFNLALSGADHSAANTVVVGDSTTTAGGTFDVNFLLTLARDVQVHETESDGWPAWRERHMGAESGNLTTTAGVGAWDPLTGILTAMGRQPQAALDYLAPATDYGATEQAVKMDSSTLDWLKGRDWDATSLEGLTSAYAGVSTFREPSTATTDERAAWLTEQAVLDLAGREDGLLVPVWSATSRQNTAIMLANSMVDVDAASRGATADGQTEFLQGQGATWSMVREDELTPLLQEVGTDDVALSTLGEAAGRYSAERQATAVAGDGATISSVATDTEQNARLAGYLMGAAQKGRELDDAESDAGINTFFTALGDGLRFVPSPQSKAAGTVISILQSHLLSSAQGALTDGGVDATVADTGERIRVQVSADGLNALAEAGMLPAEAYAKHGGSPYGYDWLQDDGTLDVDLIVNGAEGEDAAAIRSRHEDFYGWTQDDDLEAWQSRETGIRSSYRDAVSVGRGEKQEEG